MCRALPFHSWCHPNGIGPLALRRRLSTALPMILQFIVYFLANVCNRRSGKLYHSENKKRAGPISEKARRVSLSIYFFLSVLPRI